MRLRARLRFRWVDFWVGLYFDRAERSLYICLLPTVVLQLWFASAFEGIHRSVDPAPPDDLLRRRLRGR